MAGRITYYGGIVRDGLIFDLDAAKKDSYIGTGNTWSDISGNGYIGSLINGPTFSSDNGGYIRCDGINDYIEVIDNTSLDFGTNNFTVEYWFRKLATTTGYDNIWGPNKWNTGASPGTNEWVIVIGNGNSGNNDTYGFSVEVGTTVYSTGLSVETLSLNTWYQLISVRNGGTLLTYINSTLKQNVNPSGFTSSSVVNNVGRNLRINNSNANSLYTNADNSILRIYNKALTAQQILQNYNATKGRFGL